jgi:transketolase C-terminal domain/subunit
MVAPSLQAAAALAHEGIECEVVNMRFVKPLDSALLGDVIERFRHIVTVENNSIIGGFGGAVSECVAAASRSDVRVTLHGIPDHFVDHGSPAELADELGLDGPGIATVVRGVLHPASQQTVG